MKLAMEFIREWIATKLSLATLDDLALVVADSIEDHINYNRRLAECEGTAAKLRQEYATLQQKNTELREQIGSMQAAFVTILEEHSTLMGVKEEVSDRIHRPDQGKLSYESQGDGVPSGDDRN